MSLGPRSNFSRRPQASRASLDRSQLDNHRHESRFETNNLDCQAALDSPGDCRPCGWETKFGCYAAVSLTILEVKRLLLLSLEMLIDSRAIRFAGALMPIVFSFVDTGLGFPVAVATVYAIRKHQASPCRPKSRRVLRRVSIILLICAILNLVTIVLIGCEIKMSSEWLQQLFRTAMKLYARKSSYKIGLDELQLDFQCCGFNSYADWFAFDWQGTDYTDSGDREEYSERSVPFSCCNKRALTPCIHADMRREDAKSLNDHGCAAILSRILLKITIVGYTMTSLIMSTQILMIICLIRIIKKILPEICPSECTCWDSECPLNGNVSNYSSQECLTRFTKKATKKTKKARKMERRMQPSRKGCSTSSNCSSRSPLSTWSSDDSTVSSCGRLTSSPSVAPRRVETACIDPTAHQQHRLVKKR